MRRLWLASKTISETEVQKEAEEANDGKQKKLTTPIIEDMFAKAKSRGIDDSNPKRRPGNNIVSKVFLNYSINGKFAYLYFEEFLSQEMEEAAIAQGLVPKVGYKIVRSEDNGMLHSKETAPDIRRSWLEDELKLRDAMFLKEVTYDVAGICKAEVLRQFHSAIIDSLNVTPIAGNRAPTIAEAKMFDRLVHMSINKWLARHHGTLEGGISFFLSEEGKKEKEWTLLDQVDADKKDRGLQQPLKLEAVVVSEDGSRPVPEERKSWSSKDTPSLRPRQRSRSPKESSSSTQLPGMTACKHCGKPRREHKNNSFNECNKLAKKGEKAAAGKKNRGNSAKGRVPPQMLKDCATKTPGTRERPDGINFCYAYHSKGDGCKKQNCSLSHQCPKFRPDGTICLGRHSVLDHMD